ncbi:MAG: EscU/YscU/HrcU family type III secretion system export apparatus switch protein [Acidobacteria bacterium]|nr:EscU/YscU/HrcU family type III secretion system export apparatus switch protein [Acidobacteriota bacterium]
MAEDKDRRTEKPSGRRIRRAREQGQVARSQDIGHAAALAMFLLWAALGGAAFLSASASMMRVTLQRAGRGPGEAALMDGIVSSATEALVMMAPLLLLLLVGGVVGQLLQGGFQPRKNPLPFELKRLNPVTGLKNFINVAKLINAAKALLRTFLYGLVAAAVVLPEWSHVASLAMVPTSAFIGELAGICGRVLFRALLVGIAIAVVDFGVAWFRWYRQLYMTKQEVRDESKENEGDPMIRGRIRQRQREMARRRMMAAVRTADVVVTNPTHVAVALKYDKARMAAPVVIAKGWDRLAQRIKDEARAHSVPIVEDPPLARMLDKLCPLGAPVPAALYRAVAEVFAYVMGRRGRGRYRQHPELEGATS